MAKSTITIDVTGLNRKGNKLKVEIDREAFEAAQRLGILGKLYAKSIAPTFSGQLIRSIKRRTQRRADGSRSQIFIEPFETPNRSSPGNYPNFSLVRWMEETGGVGRKTYVGKDGKFYTSKTGPLVKKIKSGDTSFMTTTRRYLQSEGPREARKGFKINIK